MNAGCVDCKFVSKIPHGTYGLSASFWEGLGYIKCMFDGKLYLFKSIKIVCGRLAER